jgi:hypothetical protein
MLNGVWFAEVPESNEIADVDASGSFVFLGQDFHTIEESFCAIGVHPQVISERCDSVWDHFHQARTGFTNQTVNL